MAELTVGDSTLLPVDEPAERRFVRPWYRRVLSGLTAYLPLVLMALLALATWWLVKNTPLYQGEKPVLAPRHIPDYTMRQFTVQRFAIEGSLRVQIEGDELRHYPDTDTLEMDNARVRSIGPDGHVTLATAKHALSNGDGSEVQLTGQAHVVREAYASGHSVEEAVDFKGEFLHAFLRTEQIRSHLPVTITRGGTQLQGTSMSYDNLSRVAQFNGRVKASFLPASAPLISTGRASPKATAKPAGKPMPEPAGAAQR
ncbi:MAG: LPS export ABC transporter periplasmic protein LptC [Burkholderiaceae bacterium]|nr:LPS export ABC transporter periplasmic protein LptC [Burkholderiaceae bacterium]